MAQSTRDSAEETARHLKNQTSELAGRAQDKLDEAATRASAQARNAGEAVRGYANRAADRIDESARSYPLSSLAGALAIGVALGMLSKR